MKKFAETLTNIIKVRRYSMKEVSEGTGIPRTTLSEWVAGRSPHVSPELLKLATFLDVSLQYLLTGKDDPHDLIKNALQKTEIQSGRYLVTIERVNEQ
jgi:transcriptional regulator with XRE-family HTH domain